MAHVTMLDGREFDEDSPSALAYYRGEGATIDEPAPELRPPYTFVEGELVVAPEPVVDALESLADASGDAAAASAALGDATSALSGTIDVPGTGEPNTGVEVQQGETGEVSSDPGPPPRRR